jgi:hypothetical protein
MMLQGKGFFSPFKQSGRGEEEEGFRVYGRT